MDYYSCPADELRQEIQRRGFAPLGGQDELSEDLKNDDDTRGTDATTVATVDSFSLGPQAKLRIAYSGDSLHPSLLVGEKITHWTLDTFFPTLQLFFESGLSCTIEGGFRQNANVGLDRNLRFRLTDLTHEESGSVTKTTLPQRSNCRARSIRILEAAIAERTSMTVTPDPPAPGKRRPSTPNRPQATLRSESHFVIGLRLEGMQKMGYVSARTDYPGHGGRVSSWADVRVVGLRDDVPAPFSWFPQREAKPGSQVCVVSKGSMMSKAARKAGMMEWS